MAKNIVLCSDGTGATAVKARGTNVFKLYEAVDRTEQVAVYDDGVGAQRLRLLRMATGAFGIGLKRNVRQLYVELAKVYEPGDRIFLFGFSRGAFTVRMLAGLIVACGILDKRKRKFHDEEDFESAAKKAVDAYRSTYRIWWKDLFGGDGAAKGKAKCDAFRRKYSVDDPAAATPVHFIGVWDTVDAYGIPGDTLATFWDKTIYPFRFDSQRLSPQIAHAAHALAIDDSRRTFHPTMWEDDPRIDQVWFAGVHTNVGGGYPKQGMSLVTLDWMMRRAKDCGLDFVDSDLRFYREHADVHDHLYDSRAGLGVYYRYEPRDIGAICARWKVRPRIHDSAVLRMLHGIEGYAPGNVPKGFEIVEPTPETAPIRDTWEGGQLRAARVLIRLRTWLQYGGVVLLVLAILLTVADEWSEARGDLIETARLVWSKGIWSNLLWFPWIPIAFGIFYGLDMALKYRLRKRFSAAWLVTRQRVWKKPPPSGGDGEGPEAVPVEAPSPSVTVP
jgi:hypothetical protein